MTAPELTRRSLLRGVLVIGAAGATITIAGCTTEHPIVPSDDHAEDIGAVVQVIDNAYAPEIVTVSVGQAVHWVWESRDRHDVVGDDGTFVSELVREGDYKHIFTEAGEYPYVCSIHPEMRGTVIVTP